MNRREGVLVAVVCLAGGGLRAAPLPLAMEDPARWTRRVFVDRADGVPEADAAGFGFALDPDAGPTAAVGPWRAGEWSARLEWSRTLPAAGGTVAGRYRTEALPPFAVEVTVDFERAGKRIARRRIHLAPAEAWSDFAVPVGVLAPGTDALRLGFGLAALTEGRVVFAGLSFDPQAASPAFPADPPPAARVAPPAFLPAGEAFRVERRDGVWWLVAPSGRGVYAAGVDFPGLPRFGNRMKPGRAWAEWAAARGFNASGGWTDVWRWGPVLDAAAAGRADPPLLAFASMESDDRMPLLRDARGRPCGDRGHEFPDPFDPGFAARYRERVADVARAVRGKPWFVGWFADNEREFAGIERCVWSTPCAGAFRAFLAERYADAAALNRAWGTAFVSLEALVAAKPEPPARPGPMREDFRAFARRIVEAYARVTLAAIRAEDPGHLVFTNRFTTDAAAVAGDLLGAFVGFDGVAVNLYPENAGPGLSANETALLRFVAERTGKPLLIGEWSVPAADSGLYADPRRLDWSWNEIVATQADRARQAARVATEFYNLPFVVGAAWFERADVDTRGRKANRGLFTAQGAPWPELQAALARAQLAFTGR